MDEDQYRSIYHEMNQQRCVFEKALLNRRCDCSRKQSFLLATREGIACQATASLERCDLFLTTLRQAARFALHEVTITGPLPHNKELKVQAGGCLALSSCLFPEQSTKPIIDIDALLSAALQQYSQLENLPYSELVRGVVHYVSRPSARRS
ncbi:MAG: hypothetical protein WBP46_09400 [Thiolinea sp.]